MINYGDIIKRTENIEVRPLNFQDYTVWLDGFNGQKDSQNKFDEGWFDTSFITEEWFYNKLKEREALAQKDYSYMLNVFRISDGKSIGYCDITTHMREGFQYGRVGYTIFNNYWNHGYGKETIKALISIGFNDLDFHRLEAHINLDNNISKRVVASAGMVYECTRKGFIFEDDKWTDNEIWYINNKNWNSHC